MDKRDSYLAFLKSKAVKAEKQGIDVTPEDVHPCLFPHQRDIVVWAATGGRRLRGVDGIDTHAPIMPATVTATAKNPG